MVGPLSQRAMIYSGVRHQPRSGDRGVAHGVSHGEVVPPYDTKPRQERHKGDEAPSVSRMKRMCQAGKGEAGGIRPLPPRCRDGVSSPYLPA
jgi:hypothetical protein